jgi:hypothetical protein
LSASEDEISAFFKLEECPKTMNIPISVQKAAGVNDVRDISLLRLIIIERKSSEKIRKI